MLVCRQASERWGYSIPDELVFTDEERSGAVDQRPGYQALLEAARARRFEAIIIEDQDRLWRKQSEMHRAIELFQFWRIRILAVATGTDLTDRAGGILASVKGWMSEEYLHDLRDKVRRGMLGQLQRGFSPGGRAYGYDTIAITNPARTDQFKPTAHHWKPAHYQSGRSWGSQAYLRALRGRLVTEADRAPIKRGPGATAAVAARPEHKRLDAIDD